MLKNFIMKKFGKTYLKIINTGKNIDSKLFIFLNLVFYKIIRFFIGEIAIYNRIIPPVQIKDPINSEVIKIERIYELITFSSLYESKKYLTALLNKSNIKMLDIGSNLGRISLSFYKYSSRDKIVLIDANPLNILKAEKYIKKNKRIDYKKFTLIEKGISGKRDNLDFYFNKKFDSMGTLDKSIAVKKKLNRQKKVGVNTLPNILDEYNIQFSYFDIIKIDIEGWEYYVLKQIFEKYGLNSKQKIIVEVFDHNFAKFRNLIKNYKLSYIKLGNKNYLIQNKRCNCK